MNVTVGDDSESLTVAGCYMKKSASVYASFLLIVAIFNIPWQQDNSPEKEHGEVKKGRNGTGKCGENSNSRCGPRSQAKLEGQTYRRSA